MTLIKEAASHGHSYVLCKPDVELFSKAFRAQLNDDIVRLLSFKRILLHIRIGIKGLFIENR